MSLARDTALSFFLWFIESHRVDIANVSACEPVGATQRENVRLCFSRSGASCATHLVFQPQALFDYRRNEFLDTLLAENTALHVHTFHTLAKLANL